MSTMSSDNEDTQFQVYKDDPRIPCQYGVKCYQKNPQHHSKYKHPPKRDMMKQKAEKTITGIKRKKPIKEDKKKKSPKKKLQKIHEFCERHLHDISPSPERNDNIRNSDEDEDKNFNEKTEASDKNATIVQTSLNQSNHSLEPDKCSIAANISTSNVNVERIIKDLFLVEMPVDFFQFYEFCKSLSKNNPLMACKSICLKLVGPYDILDGKIKSADSINDKEKYLVHWRYYYDPPEFQTIIKFDDKDGLHFGYWRDSVNEKPVFVAKNRANIDCIFESVAENIFGAVDAYLQDKVKSANPFEKTGIMRLHFQLKNFAKQHKITLEKNTVNMRSRERQVVARTFHKAGIVVPYDKKTQLGYRDLAATDNDLQKILKQIEEAGTSDERKTSFVKLDEIVRLATIAADECDFGTCLELGHDLFSNGGVHVQSTALQMLSIAYTYLQRQELLQIFKVHLKDRKKGCELSVI
ncbi:histone PARylation factor 1 isoform X1 [Camponotus floridanus]|uniref:histone PARylation factor 1 isoform X1 n=1 Tax=Camponotus floridanus TaxID=104421 RepID=UPI000DC68025|nr:histone PARylation factor 1 isoform X1 [Camponotus floridanus]